MLNYAYIHTYVCTVLYVCTHPQTLRRQCIGNLLKMHCRMLKVLCLNEAAIVLMKHLKDEFYLAMSKNNHS